MLNWKPISISIKIEKITIYTVKYVSKTNNFNLNQLQNWQKWLFPTQKPVENWDIISFWLIKWNERLISLWMIVLFSDCEKIRQIAVYLYTEHLNQQRWFKWCVEKDTGKIICIFQILIQSRLKCKCTRNKNKRKP